MAKKVEKEAINKKPPTESFFKRRRYELTICAFSFVLFLNSVFNGYNLDDFLVTQNHKLTSQGISAIPEIFASPYYQDAQGYSYEYRPVVLTSFAIEHSLFGESAYVSHFINLLLYCICCLLLFIVLRNLLPNISPLLPLAISLIFVAHPAHTEAVCNIKNRDEILGLLFSLLSLYTAHKAVTGKRLWLLAIVPVVFMLALMSKITVICFIVLIPLALMLFTEAGFATVMITTFLLALPSFFLLNVGDLYNKLLIEASLLIAVALLYTFVHYTRIVAQTRRIFTSDTQPAAGVSFSGTGAGFQSFFAGINPGSDIWSPAAIVLAVIPFALFATGMAISNHFIVAGAVLVLFALAWRSSQTIAWWANTAIYACLVYAIIKFPLLHQTLYYDFVSALLAWQIVFGNRKLFIPAVTAFIAYQSGAFIILPDTDFTWPVLWLIIFSLLRLPRAKWPVVGVAGFMALVSINALKTGNFAPDIYMTNLFDTSFGALLILVSVLLIVFNLGVKPMLWAYRLFALFILTGMVAKFYQQPFNIHTVRQQVIEAGKQVNTNVLTTVQYRPLNFVEQPIKATDPTPLRIGTSAEIMWHYFYKVIAPVRMAYYYGYRFITPMNMTEPLPLLSIAIHLLLGLLALFFIHRNKLLSFGIFVYLVSIAMFSNYFYAVPGQIAERFLFIPSIGWAIALVIIVAKIFRVDFTNTHLQLPAIPTVAKGVFVVCLLFYSVITIARNNKWEDDLTLFRNDISYVDESAQAHNLLAIHLIKHSYQSSDPAQQRALLEEALGHLRKALEIYPTFFNVTYDVARVYGLLNNADSSIVYMKKTIALDSTFTDAHVSAGKMLLSLRRFDEAVPFFEVVIRRYPNDYSGYDNLSYLYFLAGQHAKSIEVNRKAAVNLPNSPLPPLNIGRTYQLGLGLTDSARFYYRRALQIDPNNQLAGDLLRQVGP